jgi:hypothetical protein
MRGRYVKLDVAEDVPVVVAVAVAVAVPVPVPVPVGVGDLLCDLVGGVEMIGFLMRAGTGEDEKDLMGELPPPVDLRGEVGPPEKECEVFLGA